MIRIIRYHGGKTIPYRLPNFRPGDVRDVELDLKGVLHGETITDAEWVIDPTDSTVGTPINTDTTTTAQVSAPADVSPPSMYYPAQCYRIDIKVTTSGGETIHTPLIMYVRSGYG